MSLKRTKYMGSKNIPWPLQFKEDPQFNIYEYHHKEKDVVLKYLIDERGVSIYAYSEEDFQRMAQEIEVISGGWYGDKGRWAPLERYVGTITCKNVKRVKKLSHHGTDYSFRIKKSFLSPNVALTMESEKIGKVEIQCKAIVPNEYDIFLFSKTHNRWLSREVVVADLKLG